MVTKGIPVTTSITEKTERFDKVSLNRYAKNLFQGGDTSQMKQSAVSTQHEQSAQEAQETQVKFSQRGSSEQRRQTVKVIWCDS
jgi:hypothetical protein